MPEHILNASSTKPNRALAPAAACRSLLYTGRFADNLDYYLTQQIVQRRSAISRVFAFKTTARPH